MGKKILLVDDDRFILKVISTALEMKGFICQSAHSVKEALDFLYEDTPEIILSDYSMPDMTGFDFRKIILADKRFSNIPFVFFTSFADEELMQEGLDMQAVDYIDKSTPLPLVASKLNNILDTIRRQHEKSLFEIGTAAEALNLRSVPRNSPTTPGFKLDFFHQTYNHYPGGDFIDFIKIDDDHTFVILGDVMGKKWGAWFFSFNFLSYIRSAIRLCVFDGNLSPASILNKINRIVCLDPVLGDILSTLSLMMIDRPSSSVYYSGAGDLPVVWYQKQKNATSVIKSQGLLLGIQDDGLYKEDIIAMESGDQLIAVTDGMIDYEENGIKKSDYSLFITRLSPILGKPDSYSQIKKTMLSENSGIVDDRSLVFIHKED